MPKVVVYSAPGCLFCDKVEEYLSQRNIPFIEKNVVEDEQALKELEELGVLTTPVVVIYGEVVIGFDRKRFEELLAS